MFVQMADVFQGGQTTARGDARSIHELHWTCFCKTYTIDIVVLWNSLEYSNNIAQIAQDQDSNSICYEYNAAISASLAEERQGLR
jgi:hypothetical protein